MSLLDVDQVSFAHGDRAVLRAFHHPPP